MEEKEREKEKKPFKTGSIWLAGLVFAALLSALVFAVARFGLNANGNSDFTPAPTRDAVLPTEGSNTPQPLISPAAPTPGPTKAPSSIMKTAIRIGSDTVIVLASRQAAEELIRNIERHFLSSGSMPDNAVVELRTPMKLEDAAKDDETMAYDEAFEFLTGPDTPLMFSAKASTLNDVVLPHAVSTVEDENMPVGLRIIEICGRDGLVREYHETRYLNGVLVSDEVTETSVIFNSVDAVIREGTMELGEDFELTPDFGADPVEAMGLSFSAPLEGRILKYYGPNEDSFHQGLDIAAKSGAVVLAACDGVVVSVMDRGAYGLLIEIDHGDGVCTRYARLRNTAVSIGDKVRAGTEIGRVAGNEYNSFFHFELRIRGVAYNPLKILPEIDAFSINQ